MHFNENPQIQKSLFIWALNSIQHFCHIIQPYIIKFSCGFQVEFFRALDWDIRTITFHLLVLYCQCIVKFQLNRSTIWFICWSNEWLFRIKTIVGMLVSLFASNWQSTLSSNSFNYTCVLKLIRRSLYLKLLENQVFEKLQCWYY